MKNYEKPALIMMSVASNDALCQSCQIDIIGDNADPGYKALIEIWNQLGGANPFDDNNSCSLVINGYCKFTGCTNVVINS